jgi:hypothetical protein
MRENCTSGSVWGAPGNGRSYHRDKEKAAFIRVNPDGCWESFENAETDCLQDPAVEHDVDAPVPA